MSKTILVCGSRHWLDRCSIWRVLSGLDKDTLIIHGCCIGADNIAGISASRLGLKVKSFPADWKKHGVAAGPIRNQQMINEGKPDIVFAFHDDWKNSKGTKDMITKAARAKIPCYLYGAGVSMELIE